MIEFWLSFQNGEEQLRLAVPPQTFEMQTGSTLTPVNIHQLGEVNVIGKRRLKAISLSSYFPIRDDGLCQYKHFPTPESSVERIERWRDSGQPIRLIIYGQGLSINEAMAIENFNYSQKHGPEDVYFTLDLKEYRFLNPRNQNVVNPKQRKQQLLKYGSKTYVVNYGDTLYWIARKLLGDGKKWKSLVKLNKLLNSNHTLKPGTKYVLNWGALSETDL
ncbi:LysM peptidoglycan-binding domain-containing protein [Paenibacillus arenosi]|uniref:LysM peptidoglycan-binding domain-containing protein n=1 Tax=Paenibacillus arenosi TaxID=2774142 RepID=A0ABR9B335_9BACL|nr:LysM peptidoglycan-binding domain-containing protein [Paenibacillus arenosi]MBD8500744.1 LysM peptidoglycan-binding domain-containing protein [Paenibacillus arenosi]